MPREIGAIHAVGEQSLRMEGIGHVDAFPPVGLNGEVDNVPGVGVRRQDPGRETEERRSIRRCRTSPLHRQVGDVAAGGIALEFGQRKRGWVRDHAIDGEAPVRKAASLKALEGFVRGSDCRWRKGLWRSGCAGIRGPRSGESGVAVRHR